MKKLLCLVSFAALMVSSVGSAMNSTISRGGFGFLFPDHNNFNNPGQFAMDKGTAIDMSYSNQTGGDQSLTPSIVYGGGTFGFGLDATRKGTSLTDAANKTDSIGAGLGIALAHQHITLGVTGSRSIDVNQTNDGTVGGTLTYNSNGEKRTGLTFGVAADTTLDALGGDTMTGTAAVGWGFNQMTRIEFDAKFNNLSNFNDYDLGGYITVEGNMLYAAGGFNYLMLNQEIELEGRVGLVFGKFDISAFVDDTMNSGNGIEFGGAARIMF